ncbi:zinc finger protein 678-like [Uranotaenia lowii]|uniref:zinc finger protein 678-like n=1 Tax=Uranotaenia lowii TaxID=190385 RepID=UPI002478BA10|nr:zinc finger protein 678-like [Uranotaenia lowii]
MLCRQVLPDNSNGIEQIYIIKTEPPDGEQTTDSKGNTLAGTDASVKLMEPEDVDEIKQEPEDSDGEDADDASGENPPAHPGFGMLDVIIKEEPDEPNEEERVKKTKPQSREFKSPAKKRAVKYTQSSSSSSSEDSDDDSSSSSFLDSDDSEDKRPRKANKSRISNRGHAERIVRRRKPRAKSFKEKVNRKNIVKRFMCPYCPNMFSTIFNLERHEKSHEEDIPAERRIYRKRNWCYVCAQEMDTKERLFEHLCTHADWLPFYCPDCENPEKIISVRILNKHLLNHRETGPGFIKCIYCSETFHTLVDCTTHEGSHKDEAAQERERRAAKETKRLNVSVIFVDGIKRYECDHCKKSYSLLATQRRHVNEHTMEKTYVCKTCGKIFNKAFCLTLHEKVHSNVKPYKCETCGKGFKEVVRLIEHRRIHTGEKPFPCLCGMAFRKKDKLNLHKPNCLIPEDMVGCVCRFCQTEFPLYSGMMQHVKERHAEGMRESRCKLCPSKFNDAVQLVIHEHWHRVPNVITCTKCNRLFRNEKSLEAHMKVHVYNPHKYMCDVCGKHFHANVNLRIHRRIHIGKRKHQCTFCPKMFYDPSTMRRHRVTHYNKNSKNFIADLPPPDPEDCDEDIGIDEDIGLDEDIDLEEDIGVDENDMMKASSSGLTTLKAMEVVPQLQQL